MLRIYYWAQFLLASGLFVAWPTSCCSFITEPSYYWPQAYLWLGPHHVIMLRIYDWAQLLLASGLFVAWPTSCYYVAPTYIMSTFIWVVNLISRGVTTVSPNMAAYICWNVHIKHSVHSQRSDIWPSLSIVTVNNNNALIAESVKASVKTRFLRVLLASRSYSCFQTSLRLLRVLLAWLNDTTESSLSKPPW